MLTANMPYVIYSALAAAVSGGVGIMVARWRARVELENRKESVVVDLDAAQRRQQIDAQAVPLQLLKDELSKREGELSALRAQDKAERDLYIKTLTAMQSALEAIAKDLSAHREEETARAGKLYEDLRDISTSIEVLEARIPSAVASAVAASAPRNG